MADTGKKVEVRYGAFACRVEGFDDPVGPLREVLSLMQRMIAETPALADGRTALDDAQVARIEDALAERRAADDVTPGIIVIRSGEPAGGDVEDAQILAVSGEDRAGETPWHPPAEAQADAPAAQPADGPDDRPEDRPAPDRWPADAGPHPSAALFAAPAAAAAEAAFAASVAAAAAMPPDESGAQGPLSAEEPEDAATPAALFAAPAAGIADAAAPGNFHSPARPGDPDDDAGEPGLPWADEAAEERVQPAGPEPYRPEPADAPFGATETGGAELFATERQGAGHDDPRHDHAPGAPGAGWAPWGSGPAGAAEMEAPSYSPASEADDPALSGQGEAAPSEFHEPVPGYDGPEDELPAFNIFAPPPEDTTDLESPPGFPAEAGAPAQSFPSLRGEPGPVPADPQAQPHAKTQSITATREMPQRADDAAASPDDDPDDVLDDGAGDWLDADQATGGPGGIDELDDDMDADPPRSAENRLAALITRYRNGLGHAAREPAPDDGAGTLSAADLAGRAGATDVDALLAASAAWLTLADGRARFTRREVMEVFETLPGAHPRTLEARIKGFGTLVRSGTLQLVDDGAFSLAPRERARFRALIDQG